MLRLTDVKKDYPVADGYVHALKGVSISFRKNEFVSILGASGCGKTTLLNIIGGLDKYTSGDLIINGVSTKKFGDKDWDTYRNHSIGFIFQSYHLIPHQTVLQNVELALTISGVSKEERRRRAIEALERVGLKDRIHNKPNQLSGGQAQRVAIARALINDPEIVLADEPTGALDSVTSVQIMELLKEISKDRLVIMVTHNPELAEKYSTRIIRLLDGEVTDDSMPYSEEEEIAEVAENAAKAEAEEQPRVNKGSKKKSSMSIGMAFMLSLKNLLSKIKRTTMVAFAGSIGIIGVSMVLAISAGVQGYIDDMENDMLSGYPLSVSVTSIDMDVLMNASEQQKIEIPRLKDKVYVDSMLETLMSFNNAVFTNVITKDYKNYVDAMPKEYYNALVYDYGFDMSNYIFTDFTHPVAEFVNEETKEHKIVTDNLSVTAIRAAYTSILEKQPQYKNYASIINTISTFAEIPNNYDYILSQYDILATVGGKTKNFTEAELKEMFESKDSLIMVLSKNAFSDLNFGQYGYMTQDEFLNLAYKAAGDKYDEGMLDKYNGKWDADKEEYVDGLNGTDFDFFLGDSHTFTWYPNDTIYTDAHDEEFDITTSLGTSHYKGLPYKYNGDSASFSDDGKIDMRVKVILQKKSNISYGCLQSGLYYTNALTQHLLETSKDSGIAEYISSHQAILDKVPMIVPLSYNFTYPSETDRSDLTDATATVPLSKSTSMMNMMMGGMNGFNAYSMTLNRVGGTDVPMTFEIYPLDFKSKDLITEWLDKWNDACESEEGVFRFTAADGKEIEVTGLDSSKQIKYTDTVGLIINMVDTMIDMITIALVSFTALSLVVSTVMVGIITYVSVVERIKEIGILRAVGARKKDIKRLFNAETFIIGLAAGIVGIVVTYLLSLIVNVIVGSLAGVYTIAALPIWQALIMICVSVGLTLISGLIPAASAAKKDPVVALRTE
ncbi:MAG: ABC transporter ATP-binding protein/permease [Clostridia bacterium]|nr:ABC transporter ATP-binding protein/permease [Clostridia bacterium]